MTRSATQYQNIVQAHLKWWRKRIAYSELHAHPPAWGAQKEPEGRVRTSFWAARGSSNLTLKRGKDGTSNISLLEIENIMDIVMLVGPEDEVDNDASIYSWKMDVVNRMLMNKWYFPLEARPGIRETEIGAWMMWTLYKDQIVGYDEATHWVAAVSIVAEIIRLMEANGFYCYYEEDDDEKRIIFEPKDRANIPDDVQHGWTITGPA